MKRFPDAVKNPSSFHTDEHDELKYTVWTSWCQDRSSCETPSREFDSSFDTLEEANLRVEYVFYYENPMELDKDEMYAENDEMILNGLRCMVSTPEIGGHLTVSVMPSAAFNIFDFLQRDWGPSGFPRPGHGRTFGGVVAPRNIEEYPTILRYPTEKHTTERKPLKYVIWTSCGYDNDDGGHSYDGPLRKTFNSSYNSLDEAYERAEYVFFYGSPWGIDDEEEMPDAETYEESHGLPYFEYRAEDKERWTVSVIPSPAFPFINL